MYKTKMKALIAFHFGTILLLLRVQFGHGSAITAKITPALKDGVIIAVGDTLELNCTLNSPYNGTYNASDLYFTNLREDTNYSIYPDVQALSRLTARLRLLNVTTEMGGLHRCSLSSTEYDLGDGAYQVVKVFRRPLQPTLHGCIISNWEQMDCSWSPSQGEQDAHALGAKSYQTVYYQKQGDHNWKTCPHKITRETCTWNTLQFEMGATYCIQIIATSTTFNVNVSSVVTCVLADDKIVKPNCAENVESNFTSDGHVTLRWNPPTSSYQNTLPLIYHLDVQNQWKDQLDYVVNATSTQLSVVPATNYTVQLSVRPSRLGFASENASHKFTTPPTGPCMNPRTKLNAFSLVKGQVRLYWQPIAQRDWCGPSRSYEVRAKQSVCVDWRTVSLVGPLENSAEVMLNSEEDEVTIESKNSLGVATHLTHTILRIPSSSSAEYSSSSSYRLVVEGDDKTVMVHWFTTAPVEDVKDYTLFWCKQRSVTRFCETPIQWKNLNGTEFEYNLTLSENFLHFQVGLAVNFRSGITSGIKWAEKLYSQTAEAEAPDIVKEVSSYTYLTSHGEIDLNWTPSTSCNERCAYIHTFVIHYCLANHQNVCHGANQSVSIESWKGTTYRLVNLDHGSKYMIWMTSVARTGSSKPSEPVCETTTKSWLTAGVTTGIVFAAIFMGVVAFGLYVTLRRVNKYRREFVNGMNIPIALPPIQRVQLKSTSSETPMLLVTETEYNRLPSVSSNDSGRCSLSPASQATSPLLSETPYVYDNMNSYFMPETLGATEYMKVEGDRESTHGGVLSYTNVPSDVEKGKPVVVRPEGLLTTKFNFGEDMKVKEDRESTHGCVLSCTIVSNDATKGKPVMPKMDSFMTTNCSALEDALEDGDDDSRLTHDHVLSFTIVSSDTTKGGPAKLNPNSLMPTDFGAQRDTKVENDDDSTHDGVFSYTIVSDDASKGKPNCPANVSNPTISSVVSNEADPSDYILPDQMELPGMLPMTSLCTESDMIYITHFDIANPSMGNVTGNAANITYAEVKNLDTVNGMATADAVNEISKHSIALQFDTNQNEATFEKTNSAHTMDQRLTNLSQANNPGNENREPPPTRSGDNDAPFLGHVKHVSLNYSSLAGNDVECQSDDPDYPQQSPSSMSGYIDHVVFGIE